MKEKITKILKLHQLSVVFLLIILSAHIEASNENVRKINTDLTVAGVVGSGGAAAVGSVSEDKSEGLVVGPNQNIVERPEKTNTNLTTNAANICTREETYNEQLKVPSMQPVRIRSSTWCMEFPPRCSNYKTEMREVVKVQNLTKTRTIRFCCSGYEGNISINDTVCKPVCRGGCGRGYCQTPDICSCEAGYTGKHCTQRCDHDHWGVECKNECQCQNGAVCDNKTGLCHCTTGWAGEYCELHCPFGTYGVMCRKTCECPAGHCHPQSGACEPTATANATPNATHVMIQTLNSTINNITHNLDRIAKNIVTIVPSTTVAPEVVTLRLPELLEVATQKALPEVIVIKQDEQHTPKIIVHQPGAGLLEDLHTAAAKAPEVIHVITSWQQGHPNATHEGTKLDLASFGGISHHEETIGLATATNSPTDHDSNLLTTLLIILLIIMIVIALAFLYVYRRYHWQKERMEAAGGGLVTHSAGTGSAPVEVGLGEAGLGKSFLKPLPDLPGFTQMVRNKIEGPEYYDSPSNNSSIKTPSYAYARKESLYSVVPPKSRKGSMDSHLYDEIRYPTAMHHHHHHQHQSHAAQHHNSYAPHQPSVSRHVTHLVIPPQNANFLQVPQMSHSSHKVGHM